MKKIIALTILIFLLCHQLFAQQQFTITSSRANNYCNGTCTLLDNPDLNGNPAAIIFITPVEVKGINLNPHPVCAYYIGKQWSVKNIDNTSMPPGAQFNVQYYSKPDDNHFVHVVTRENLVKKNSYIDHPGLNDNPSAQFQYLQNWAPSFRGGNINLNDIKIQYDAIVRKWYISNSNNSQLEFPAAYNIIISNEGSTVAGTVKVIPDISIKDPKTVIKSADTLPVINKSIVQKEIIPQKILSKAYDFSNVHICLDQPSTKNLPPRGALPKIPKIKANGEINQVSSIGQELSVVTSKMWTPGSIITVGFFSTDATPYLISKVKTYAKVWETFANIKFQFVDFVDTANVKVGFKPTNQSWSWLGRDVMFDTLNLETVNFGWFNNQTPESEFRRVIVHEFGHVLGFIHEHSSPAAGIPWDKDKVYTYFRQNDGWSTATVDNNIFKKYSTTETNSSSYDRLSIMHYFFPKDLVTDGSMFTENTNLSATDMQFAGTVYPFPPTPPTATGVLLTGDDCDEIEFTVSYNYVQSSDVEFLLVPGRDPNNNLITWWKKVGIPLISGDDLGLEMQDGYSTTRIMSLKSIDRTKPITFGKAKILGVHTGLTYTWNPWPAITGGCLVKFVWRRDKCGGL